MSPLTDEIVNRLPTILGILALYFADRRETEDATDAHREMRRRARTISGVQPRAHDDSERGAA